MIFARISIVVPSFNQGQYLEETLLSIINQAYPNLELFVVDGGSTDNSVEIIKKYQQHITWWVSEKDKGQSNAINKGLTRATGEIITWINSDDLLTPGALHSVAKYFSSMPSDVGFIHGATILFDEKREIKKDWGYSNPSLERNLAGMAFPQPAAFFLKKYLDIIGAQVNDQLHYGMDYDLFSRLACICRFFPVKDIFSKYRLHDSSKSVMDQDKFIGDWSRVFVNLCKNLGWNDMLDEMRSSGFFEEEVLAYYDPFVFTPEKDINRYADKKKILFYHYCYMLKAFYWSGQREVARRMLKHLKHSYPSEWIKNEKDFSIIIKKLGLPDILLRVIKKIKSYP
jgi:glycosyltransferase involved in cell wall biosynthesis